MSKENVKAATPVIMALALGDIIQRDNSRIKLNDQDMAELMTSMKRQGQFQPIGVSHLHKGKWEVVWGNRRFLAAKKLGWKTIDAVDVATTDQQDIQFMNLAENIHRVDVTLPEQGKAYAKLEEDGLTVDEIASRLSVNASKVRKALRAYNHIPEKVRKRIRPENNSTRSRDGMIPPSTALNLLAVIKTHKLNEEQADQIYEWGVNSNATLDKIPLVAKGLKAGLSVTAAIETVEDIRVVRLYLPITKKAEKVLGIKYPHQKVENLMKSFLMTNPEFGIISEYKRGV